MKVNIKKDGKVKKYKVVSKWSEVSLDSWARLVEFTLKTKSGEALETIAELSNIPKDLISKLELSDIVIIMSRIATTRARWFIEKDSRDRWEEIWLPPRLRFPYAW